MEINWTKFILTASIAVLMGAIVLLVILLIPAPETQEEKLNFTQVIELSKQAMGNIEFIRLVYDVNVTDENNRTFEGEMIYSNRNGRQNTVLAGDILNFTGYALLPNPMQAFEIIQKNRKANFANDLHPLKRPCHSTFVFPENMSLKVYTNGGKVAYMACMDNEVGYPTLILVADYNGTHTAGSRIFLKSIEFNKKS